MELRKKQKRERKEEKKEGRKKKGKKIKLCCGGDGIIRCDDTADNDGN